MHVQIPIFSPLECTYAERFAMPDGNRMGSGCSLPSLSRDFAIQQSSLRQQVVSGRSAGCDSGWGGVLGVATVPWPKSIRGKISI